MENNKILEKSKDVVDSLKGQDHVRKHLEKLKSLDGYTYNHSSRVAVLAVGMGILNNFNDSQLRILGCAGLLHDVGKLDIDSEVLNKDDPLTEKERQEIKKHPRFSFQRLGDDFSSEIKNIVLAHHEHQVDPYPSQNNRGAENNEELSQIIAVADMFDALSSKRSYKDSFSKDKIEEIMSEEFVGNEKFVDQILNIGFNLK